MEDQYSVAMDERAPGVGPVPGEGEIGGAGAQVGEAPLAYRAVRGGLAVAASAYANIIIGFLANLVLTRLLAPEAFGIFSLATFFFSLLNLRPKLGTGQAFAQRPEMDGEHIGTLLTVDVSAAFGSLALAAIALAVLPALGYAPAVGPVVVALAIIGISEAVMGTAWVLLDKNLAFGRVSLVMAVAFPLSYLPAFALALRGAGYWSLVGQSATYSLLLLAGLWWTCRRYLPGIWRVRWRFSRPVAGQYLRFGTMVGLATTAGALVAQFDNFLVGSVVGLAVLGFYDRAYRIGQWPALLVSNVLSRTAFYTYARLQADVPRLTRAVTMSLWLTTTLALPLALAIFAAAPDLVRWLWGDTWLPSALFVRFLVIYSFLRPLLDNANALFTAVGRPRLLTLVTGVQAAALVVAATPLTVVYGAPGTCVGVGLAFVVGLAFSYYHVRRIVPLSLWDAFWGPALSALLAMAAYLLFTRLVDLNLLPLWSRVAIKAAFASGLFLALVFAFQPRRLIERSGYVWQLVRARG